MTRLLKIKDVSSILGLSESCIYKKAERGEIQSVKIGTALRFSESDIQDFIEKCRKQDAPSIIVAESIDYKSFDYENIQ